MNKKFLFFFIVFFEIVVVVFLGTKIYRKKNILGKTYIAPINRKELVFPKSTQLRYFYEPKPNTIDDTTPPWGPKKAINTINSDGLNERFNYSIKKPPKAYRIITLGNSFTYGLYVDTKDNWPEKLEDLLNEKYAHKCKNFDKFEVINLAVHGYDFQYNVERFKRRGEKYNPDLIIWFVVDEFRIDELIRSYEIKIRKELEMKKEFQKLNSYYPWNQARRIVIDKLGIVGILKYQLSSLSEFTNIYNGPLIFIYGDWIRDYFKDAFDDILKKHYSKYMSLTISIPEESRFPNDGHPNEKGHRQIANTVYNFLIDNKVIPCE